MFTGAKWCCGWRRHGVAVEYGAIEIILEAFAEPLRTRILEAHFRWAGC